MIHYDYGNDYMPYYNVYKQVTSYRFDLSGILAGDYFREPGWVLLCWFFKPIGGFFMMVAVLNLIENMLVYRTIKIYVEKKWWPLSVFIYLFSTSLYLLNFSMMRQKFIAFPPAPILYIPKQSHGLYFARLKLQIKFISTC